MKSVLVGLLIVIIVLIECMAGGTRLALALPCYMLLGVAALLALFQRPAADARARPSCLIISAAFFTYILLRASRSPVTYLWWHDFYMVMACLIVYLITIFYVTSTRQRRVFIWALLGLAVLEVIFGIRQFVHGDEWMPLGFTRASAGRRASGTLISSIHLAGYLEVVGLFALSFAFWSAQRIWARILAGYLALMCYGGVAITGSRGGYLSTLASIVVFAAISLHAIRATRPKKLLPAVLLVGGLVVIGLCGGVAVMSQNEFLRSRLSTIPKQLERQHLDVRIYNWQAALDHFRVQPVVGTGAGTHLHYGRVFRRPPLQADPIHAHNDYLELLAEYGIIGGLGMALFLAAHLRSGWKIYSFSLRELRSAGEWVPARDDSLALTIGAFSAISAYLVHSISDFNLHIPGHALIFAFIFGILVSPARDLPAVHSTRATGLFRWALLPLGGWILAFSIHTFGGEYWAEKARYAFRETDFTNSIAHANRALAFHEENYELFFYLGGAHRGLALIEEEPPKRVPHLEAAVRAYARCLALFPQDVHALVRLAQTLGELGRFKEAEAIYLSVLELDPNLARAHAYYAAHLARVGRHEKAKARLSRALELSPFENYQPIVRGTSLDPAVHSQ